MKSSGYLHMDGEYEEDDIKAVQFAQIESSQVQTGGQTIDILVDVPLEVVAELGRAKMLVKDILKLGIGSVIELEKEAGEPVDIRINNKLIARGEVVAIDDYFGVRVTELGGEEKE